MRGRTISTRVNDPVNILYPIPSVCPKNIIPKRPNIIDGIPESVSVANSIPDTNFPGFAYSFKYTAAPTPTGVAIIIVITMIYNVLRRFPAIPSVPLRTDVSHVRNSQLI